MKFEKTLYFNKNKLFSVVSCILFPDGTTSYGLWGYIL